MFQKSFLRFFISPAEQKGIKESYLSKRVGVQKCKLGAKFFATAPRALFLPTCLLRPRLTMRQIAATRRHDRLLQQIAAKHAGVGGGVCERSE